MREIKFRAWDKLYKVMRKVLSVDFEKQRVICPPRWHAFSEWYNQSLSFDEVLLLQYTGLKDKNGKEIYEGDIIFVWNEKCPIAWIEEEACFGAKRPDGSYWGLDEETRSLGINVIGNIYENPELLEGER